MRWPPVLARYDVVEEELPLTAHLSVRLARIKDVNALVDAITELDEDERLPYWATLWPAAVELARHLIEHPARGPAIELGAGLGLCTIVAAKLGLDVMASDYEADALAFIERNAELNGVRVRTQLLDWRSPESLCRFSLVLGADVLYEARKITPLLDTIERSLKPDGLALLSDPRRPHLATFEHSAAERGFQTRRFERPDATIIELHRH